MAPPRSKDTDPSRQARAVIKRTDRLFDQAEELQREARRELAHHFGSSPDRPAADDSARRGRITRQRHK